MLRLALFLLLSLSVCVYPQTAQELQKLAQEQKRTGRVFLNFQDTDISLVAKFMSELTGKNIILDPAVKGTITVSSAKPVSVQTAWEMFLLALSLQGYGVVEGKNYVSIVPLQKATSLANFKKPSHSGEVIVYIYKAENTQALQLQQAIQPFLSPNAKFTVHAPSNSLIIADVAQNIERVKKILKELDSPKNNLDFKLYKLQKANAESVFQNLQTLGSTIQQQLGTPIFITFSKDSNSIVVAANEKVQGLIKEVIENLDRESLGPLERSFYLIKLNHISAEELYRSLQTLFGGKSPITQTVQPQIQPQEQRITPTETRGTEIPLKREEQKTPQRQTLPLTAIETKEGLRIGFDRGTNSVIIYGTPQEYESLKSFIEKIDVRRKQVLIAATVVEMSTRQALELGVRWQILGTQGGSAFGGSSLQDVYSALLSGSFVMGTLSRSGTSVTIGSTTLFFPDLVLLFSLLEKGSGFNIISNPKVLTLDNQEAIIKVGQVVPFASGVKFDINGQPIITYDYKEVGLSLSVTPTISGKDLRLLINLNLQEIIDFLRPQIGTLSYAVPITSNRQLNSDVVVENGQTIIIGGLVSTRTLDNIEGVPGLKDIPVLGWLFKRKTTSEDKVSLFIFLTPYVIEKPEDLSKITEEHQKLAQELRKKAEEANKKKRTKNEAED
ncbi:type II secretion system secretin GspD [Thermocrinis sp.]|jgi:general secretion pathway protein D|uniref:type II secretion system secretin GspD n=1 Tax=Thermocrinis sp. TaxID=2024383 RepID=UPI00261590AF|nr:type II secretion system secretin GspD [Thermocrinis sp.]